MPTIKQLPAATSVAVADLLPLSQGGTTKALAVGALLSSVQPAIALATGKLLGRVSSTAGGPEPVGVGAGLAIALGTMTATGSDHTQFPVSLGLTLGDEVVVNSGGVAKRLQAASLRSLFSAGTGVTIDGSGAISALGGGAVAVATAASPGVVRVGTGLSVSAQGNLTPDGTVVALRSALAGVALSGAYGDLFGRPALGGAAALNVGAATGTVAAGDDARLVSAVQGPALGSAVVKATGGMVARTVADHAADGLTVADLGVSSNSAIDQTAAFQAAQNALQSGGGGTLRVGAGSYQLAANVFTVGSNAWLFERGAQLTGVGEIDAVVDGQALGSSGMALARLYSSPANEHGIFVSVRAASTSGSGAYEKTGIIASTIQGDPSVYATGALKDLVGVESQGEIAPGNLTGRIWGFNSGVGPLAGADGYAVGGEFGVQSYSGSDAGSLGTPTSKIGVHSVAYGNSTSTAAFVASGNGTTWQDGYVVQIGHISAGGHALSIRPAGTTRASDIAYVAMDGSAAFTSLTVGGVAVRGGAAGVATFNGRGGAVVLSAADVAGAIGYTAYSGGNPAGYQTAAQVSGAIQGAAYALPVATTTALGGVKVDGTTVTVSGGVISAPGSGTVVVPVTTILVSGSAQTLAAPASGSRAYDLTLSANCTLSLAGGTAGQQQTITIYLRQNSTAGWLPTLPAGVKWPGGTAPTPNTARGVIDVFHFATPDAGATWFGSY